MTYADEPMAKQATTFKSNDSQAARLPVARFDDAGQVDVAAIERARTPVPPGESWDSWFDGEGATPDFMLSREQPGKQEREGF